LSYLHKYERVFNDQVITKWNTLSKEIIESSSLHILKGNCVLHQRLHRASVFPLFFYLQQIWYMDISDHRGLKMVEIHFRANSSCRKAAIMKMAKPWLLGLYSAQL